MTTPEAQALMEGWEPIESAPQDGSVIWLTAFDGDGKQFEVHPMQWAHIQRNGLFPGNTGMWTHPTGAYTWNDDGQGGGPTHWRALSLIEATHGEANDPKGTANGRS